jgi:hypothetical protein
MSKKADKSHRGNASQFFVAGELCRRGWMAVVTMGNCPNTDVLVTNKAGTKFVHVQVKTFVPGNKTCSVGMKSERDFGENFFWVLAGIPEPNQKAPFIYYILPSSEMSFQVSRNFKAWAETPGKKGQPHDASTSVRTITLPPQVDGFGWNLNQYQDRWDLIEAKLL